MDLNDSKSKDFILSISRRVYDLILNLMALLAEHNDGLIAIFKQFFGSEVYKLFEDLKTFLIPIIF